VRRPRPFVPLSSAAAALVVAAVTFATQVGDARPGGTHVAAAAEPTVAAPRDTSTIDPSLTSAIKAKMAKSTSSSYGVVVDVEGLGRVVDINGGRALLPASTEKLFTTLPLLLDRPNDRLVTTVGTTSAPVAGVVHGDLVVRATADPSLTGAGLADLAKQVRSAGVRTVTGRLVLDVAGITGARTRSGWKSSYVPWDVGPLSPFAVHFDNWRTSSSYVSHPTNGNLGLLRAKLKKAGVRVSGGNAVVRGATVPTVLARHSSASLAGMIGHTLRASDNFFAEQMLNLEGMARVNAVASDAGADGSATDGSGLSLRDRRSAAGEVAQLEYAHSSSAADLLLGSLPVACRSGTLKDEMCKTVAAGKVFAKTGTLNHVKALAGYTTDAQGRWVTFAFLTNGDSSTYKAMNAIERAVLVLRRYGS
jgi:D-alanyl-D-alanine carboxypeptidase/D-alanyl-D-alanine-endopeptidase (penicillin-binding protein 4)